MALYRLTKMKLSREEDGKRVRYGLGKTVELTDKEARSHKWGIERVSGGSGSAPDDDLSRLSGSGPDDDESILSENVPEVVSYLNEHADDEDLLNELREAEMKGKRRKKVIDTIDDLLTKED